MSKTPKTQGNPKNPDFSVPRVPIEKRVVPSGGSRNFPRRCKFKQMLAFRLNLIARPSKISVHPWEVSAEGGATASFAPLWIRH